MNDIENFTEETVEKVRTLPNNHMPLAIISTIIGCLGTFCFGFILGMIAIYFSSLVRPKFKSGDYLGAQQSARTSSILSYIALGIGIIGIIIGLIYQDQYLNEYQNLLDQYRN